MYRRYSNCDLDCQQCLPDCNNSSNIYSNCSTCINNNTRNKSITEWMSDSSRHQYSIHFMVSKRNHEWRMSGSYTYQQRTRISTIGMYRRNSNCDLDCQQCLPDCNNSSNIYGNRRTCINNNPSNES